MTVLAVGSDLVQVSGFAAQLEMPGSKFGQVFSNREWRQVRARASMRLPGAEAQNDTDWFLLAPHLAARWAGKESFIKAWSNALYGCEPPLAPEEVAWQEIECVQDAWGRIKLRLSGQISTLFEVSLARQAQENSWPSGSPILHTSLSHDGDYASGVTVLSWQPGDPKH